MVGIPLMNLGTALGGLTQGYQNYQTNQIQNAIRQLALSQAQRQNQAATLAGLGLSAGLLNQQPISPITNAPTLPVSQPPPPGQPSLPTANLDPAVSSTDPGPGGHGTPTAAGRATYPPLPTPDQLTAPPPASPAPASDDQPPSSGAAMAPGLFNLNDVLAATNPQATQQPAPTPQQPAPAPAPAPTQQPPAEQQPPPPPAPTPAAAIQQSGGEGQLQIVMPNGQAMPIPDFFRSIDTTKVAQGLARLAPPGTDPATIYEATADLLKLSNGNKEQQIQAATLAKLFDANLRYSASTQATAQRAATAAGAQTAATERTRMTVEGAQSRAELGAQTRLQVANINAQVRRDTAQLTNEFRYYREGRIDERAKQRLQANADKLLLSANQAGALDLSRQVSAIRAQIATVKPTQTAQGMSYTEEQQKYLAQKANELDRLNAQLADMAAKVTPGSGSTAPSQ